MNTLSCGKGYKKLQFQMKTVCSAKKFYSPVFRPFKGFVILVIKRRVPRRKLLHPGLIARELSGQGHADEPSNPLHSRCPTTISDLLEGLAQSWLYHNAERWWRPSRYIA